MRKQALRARSCRALLVLTAVLLLASVSDGIRLVPAGKFLFELLLCSKLDGAYVTDRCSNFAVCVLIVDGKLVHRQQEESTATEPLVRPY
jgi:hypothetical protein